MRTSITVIMTDDTVFEKPFVSDVHAEKIALGNIEVLRSELPRFSIHATQSQWRALAAYCLECAEALEKAGQVITTTKENSTWEQQTFGASTQATPPQTHSIKP